MFFDTCFLHGTPLIQTKIDIHDLHTETGFEDQYDVEKIVSAYKSADVIFESVKATQTALILKSLNALGKLTVANSIALRDGKTNGELKSALTEYEVVEKELYEYLISTHN